MNSNNGNSSSGFVLGLLLGGVIVFLVGTDRGRKVLKAVTEEGFDGLSDLIENAGEKIEEEMEASESNLDSEEIIKEEAPKSNGHKASVNAKKRFFRRPAKS
jgi:uncharacterized protein YcfJ